ncbi:MAG: UDP-glucose dehydrogenase family protein [Bacteroidia bacterium]
MEIAVIGVGYVGLVTACGLAETGNQVWGYDIDAQKIADLMEGQCPIYEPGLDILLKRNKQEGRLTFTTDLEEAVTPAELIFLALPTPPAEDGSADLKHVFMVAEALLPYLRNPKIVITKSTVPVGTAQTLQAFFDEHGLPVSVVSNPEFLREGYAVEDFMKPDRVVIGAADPQAAEKVRQLYLPYVRSGNPIYIMDWTSAELTKYAANAYLATRISFMNEIARLCEKVGANVDWVRMGMGADSRIGKKFLFPGIGYGGSCFPKDTLALLQTAQKVQQPMQIVSATVQVNHEQRSFFYQKISSYFGGNLAGKTFAIWGLSFKPNTDDVREAPSLYLVEKLLSQGVKLRLFDPAAMPNFQKVYPPSDELFYAQTMYQALEKADALIILTEWNEFRTPQWNRILENLTSKVIFDGRNLYEISEMEKLGIDYFSIGRPAVRAYKVV